MSCSISILRYNPACTCKFHCPYKVMHYLLDCNTYVFNRFFSTATIVQPDLCMCAFCTLYVREEGQNCRCAFGKPAKAISTPETEFVRCSTWVAYIEKCSSTTSLPSVYASQVPDTMTTSQGHPIDSKTSTLTVGPQGPVLLQDFTFIDEMAHFDRERIPERVVHAKGAGRSVRC